MHNRLILFPCSWGKLCATTYVWRERLGTLFAVVERKRVMLKMMLLAGVGGFVGTCLRYLTGRLCHLWMLGGFPLGTFVVNVAGCFLIGVLLGLAERGNILSATMNVMLVTGFCGGFTTFSSFADDVFLMLQHRNWTFFVLYAGLSLILGIVMVWIGRVVGK